MIGALFLIGLLLASGLAATGGAPVPEHTTDAMGEAGAADARAADIAPGGLNPGAFSPFVPMEGPNPYILGGGTPGGSSRETGSRANDDPGNDQLDGATALHPGAIRLNQSVENGATTSVDIDWYSIRLNYTGSQTERLQITINRTSDSVIQALIFEPPLPMFDQLTVCEWQWIGAPMSDNVTTIDTNATRTGWYYLLVGVSMFNASTQVDYNIENVTVTTTNPSDSDNYFDDGGAISPTNIPTNKKVTQRSDRWDWYNASAAITTEHPENGEHTNMTLSVDVLNQIANAKHPDPTFAAAGVQSFAWTWGSILFNDAHGNWYMNTNLIAHGGSVGVSVGGSASEPFSVWANCNGTEAYFGITTFTFIILNNQLIYGEFDGWADYSVQSFTTTEFIPNDPPYLLGGAVDRNSGYKTDEFNFNVTYYDPDDNDATQVKMVWNSGMSQEYLTLDPGSSDGSNLNGENYVLALTGEDLGEGTHYVHFEASDGQDPATPTSQVGPIAVSFNTPPEVLDDTVVLNMEEDQPAVFLQLENLFADLETPQGVVASVALAGTQDWGYSLETDAMVVDCLNYNINNGNRTVRVTPRENMYGSLDCLIRAQDASMTYSGNVSLSVTISEVNDLPMIESINGDTLSGNLMSLTVKEDRWLNLTLVASDADGDTVTFSSNGTTDLDLVDGDTYKFSPATGNFGLLFENDMVGVHYLGITASDGRGGIDVVNIQITVENVNDAPELSEAEDQEAEEDEWLQFSLDAGDEDWSDPGEKFSLSTDAEDEQELFEVEYVDYEVIEELDDEYDGDGNFLIAYGEMELKGKTWKQEIEIAIRPSNAMVDEYEISFTLKDKKGARASTSMELTVENTNDPPYFEPIGRGEYPYVTMDEETNNGKVYAGEVLTFTAKAHDIDLDVDPRETLTYTWEFGDDSFDSGVDLEEVEHEYEMDGRTYVVNVTAEDAAGESVTESYVVEVRMDPKADTDDDGMLDVWEVKYDLDRFVNDADEDADGDGVSNFQEHEDNTDPTDENSYDPASKGGSGPSDGSDGTGGAGSSAEGGGDSGLLIVAIMVAALVSVVVVFLMLVIMRKRSAAAAAAKQQEQTSMYDPYGAYGTGGYDPYSQQGAVGGADMSGDPSAPPPMTGAGGDAAGLGVGDSTTHPSKQLPPAKTDTSDMGEGSSDPLAPLEDKKPGFKPPKPPTANNGKGAGAGGAAAGGQDAKGGGTCPSCGAAVQAGWFICPKCKNPLS